MIINNQFYIFTYTGSQPLDLMEVPEEISNDSIKLARYNAFIQSIDSIYGSQNINDDIPVFWTRKVSSVDSLGNNIILYRPHPDSSLTQLDSKQSYYVIVRELESLPISVPFIGNIVSGFTDFELYPSITAGLTNKSLEDSNRTILSPSIQNLQPNQIYRYKYNGLSSNWPITIHPISGLIKPATTNTTLSSILTFCATSGACCGCVDDPNIISGVIPNRCPSFNEINLYSTIELEIEPISYSGDYVKSNPITIECRDCLPRVKITLEDDNPYLTLSSGITTTNITAKISNLEPTQNYIYEYVGLGSNWPMMFITPISGIIKSYSYNKDFILNSKIAICPTTGLCPNSDSSVINYNIDPKFIDAYYSSILLKVTPETCIEPFYLFQSSSSVYSSPLTIYCNDCL